jgi:hypothetical protein
LASAEEERRCRLASAKLRGKVRNSRRTTASNGKDPSSARISSDLPSLEPSHSSLPIPVSSPLPPSATTHEPSPFFIEQYHILGIITLPIYLFRGTWESDSTTGAPSPLPSTPPPLKRANKFSKTALPP